MGTAAAVVGAGSAIYGAKEGRDAQKDAAKDAERGAMQSAKLLEEAGRKGQQNILFGNRKASEKIASGAQSAAARLDPFAATAQDAYNRYKNMAMTGGNIGGAIGSAVQGASKGAVNSRLFDTSGVTAGAIDTNARQLESAVSPMFRDSLLSSAQSGMAATTDRANILSRGYDKLADLAGATGSQRASLMVGSNPQLQRLSTGAEEARLLGDVAGQNFNSQMLGQLSNLAGRYF